MSRKAPIFPAEKVLPHKLYLECCKYVSGRLVYFTVPEEYSVPRTRKKLIITMHTAGMKSVDIAKYVCVHPNTVYRILSAYKKEVVTRGVPTVSAE
jgi:Mor family transcriptional regulator